MNQDVDGAEFLSHRFHGAVQLSLGTRQIAEHADGPHAGLPADFLSRIRERGSFAVSAGPCSRIPWTPIAASPASRSQTPSQAAAGAGRPRHFPFQETGLVVHGGFSIEPNAASGRNQVAWDSVPSGIVTA